MADEGQLQPIRSWFDPVRGKYVIIAGNRRYLAAKLAGFETLECIVEERPLDEATLLRQELVENLVREPLNPIEQGRAFLAAMIRENLDQKQLADRLNIHPSTVCRAVRLLKLNEEAQSKVQRGELPITQALKETAEATRSKACKHKPAKPRKISIGKGVSLTINSRKPLTDAAMLEALRAAITKLESAITEPARS